MFPTDSLYSTVMRESPSIPTTPEVAHLLSEIADTAAVTRDELDNFDDSTFDTTNVAVPPQASDPAHLLSRLDNDDAPQAERRTALLSSSFGCGKSLDMVSLVIRAFAEIRQGCSADLVIAEPELNLLFLQRCWKLGAMASADELSWILFNARKEGRLSPLPRSESFSLPRSRMDEIGFASEIAMRYVQDKVYFSEQRSLTLDKLLCDRKRLHDFDEHAKLLAPGYRLIDYRWAAISLRKARRRLKSRTTLPNLTEMGRLDCLRVSSVSQTSGLFWFTSEHKSAFVGVADNLRLQIDRFLAATGPRIVPQWIADRKCEIGRLFVLETPQVPTRKREELRAAVLQAKGSRLNFQNGGLLDSVA